MICNKCAKYGHREKHCQEEVPTCRRCSVVGHRKADCQAESPRCLHCSGEHFVGDKRCSVEQREQTIIDIQTSNKVTMRRARQIFESNSATSHKSVKYPTHFNCILNEEEKKTMSPWLLEKVFSQAIGSGPKSIRSISSSTYVVEAKDQKQSEKIAQITNLNN